MFCNQLLDLDLGIRNRIKQSKFVRQVLGLGSGVIVAHLITLALSPVITRLYTPDQFGEYALFTSLVAVLTLIATGAYEFSIVLPKKDTRAVQLFKLSLLWSAVFIGLMYAILFAGFSHLKVHTSLSTSFLLLLPLGVFASSLMSTFSYWFNRKEYFDEFAQAKVSMSIGTGLFQVGLGATGFTSIGLMIGLISGRLFSAGTMALKKIDDLKRLFKNWVKGDLKDAAKEYSDHPKFVLLSSLLSSFSIEIPVFLITSLFGSQELGYYGLSLRVLMAPVTFVSLSVGQVYYQKFAARKNSGEKLAPFLLRLWGILSLIGIIPFTLLFFFSEPVFVFIFGSEWANAGIVSEILAPMLFFLFMMNPTSKSLLVLDQQRIMPLFSAGSLIIRLATLIIGYLYFDFYIALSLMAFGQIVMYILQSTYTYLTAKTWDSNEQFDSIE